MVGTTLKLRTNENDTDNKFSNIKKFGATTTNSTTEVTKRAAFGEIQNRGVLRAAALTGKDAVQKDLKDTKLQNALRNTKARVDTQWKKGALGGSSLVAAAATTKTEVAAKTAATGAVGERKILTRTNSVRQITTTTTSTANAANGLQRHASSHLILGQKQTKTLTTTRLVENKLQQVKLVNKAKDEKVVVEAKASATTVTSSTTTTTLRREDSNLSRKSLTKLRAALASNKNSTTKATAAVSGLIAKKTTTQTATSSSSSTTASANAAACTAADIKIVSVQTHSSKFLEAVEDIDAADGDNLALVSEYVNDIYNYLYTVEVQQSIMPDHLEGQAEVTPKMRAVLIDWINEVHFQFRLAPETFQMAIAIIDRYLQVVQDTKRTHLQLVGVTALFIATKYEELLPPAITDFVFITDDTYTAKQIRQMELKILKALDYNLARPLPIHFLRRYSKAAYAEDRHHGMSKYFLELAAVEYDMAAYKPSEVAASSLFLAMNLLNDNAKLPTGLNNKHWTPTLEHYSRYTPEHLRPIAKKIAAIARNAQTAKLRAAFNKYESIKMDKISLRPELYGPLMDSIIKSKD